jgi:hypothetical protein
VEEHRIRTRAGVISGVLVVNGTSTCRETPYDLFLRPAILYQRGGTNQATGRMSEHIEAAILLIIRNWPCDTLASALPELRSNDDVAS